MKRLIVLLYLAISMGVEAHAPVEHARLDFDSGISEARQLILSFRRTGNDEYLATAWNLVQADLASNPSVETLMTAAFVTQSRHQFHTSRRFVEKVLSIDPRHNEAHLLLASIHLVTGETQAAKVACSALRQVPLLLPISCHARVALATNNAQSAYPKLRRLLVLPNTGASVATLAWAQSIAGDLAAQLGDEVNALDHYRHSLGLVDQVQVRSALADVLLELEKSDEVLQMIDHHESALPLLVRRLIALAQLKRLADSSDTLTVLDRAFSTWIQRQDWMHAREMSRFYLDVIKRPKLARFLALKNIAIQKEPEDLRLVRRTQEFAEVEQFGVGAKTGNIHTDPKLVISKLLPGGRFGPVMLR